MIIPLKWFILEKYKTLEEIVDSLLTPKEGERFSKFEESKILNLTQLLKEKDFLNFHSSVKLKLYLNEVELNGKDFIYPAIIIGGLALSYTYSNHFINFLKFMSQESKYLSGYYQEFLENYKSTFRPFMNFAGVLSLLYSSTFNSFTSIKYFNQVDDKKEKVFIGSMLALSSLALGYSTYALFSNLFSRISLNLFKEELKSSLFNITPKMISPSDLLLEKNYFFNTLNGLFKSLGSMVLSISPILYPSLIPHFHKLYNNLTGKEGLAASVLLLPSGKYSLNANKTRLGDFLNHSLFFIEEKYVIDQKHSLSDLAKLVMSPLSKLSFYTLLNGYNFKGKEERLNKLSDNSFWKVFSTSGAFINENKKSADYISSLISEGKKRIGKYVDEVNLPEQDKELLTKYLMPFYLSALHTDAPSKVLHSKLNVEMTDFLNYALSKGYLMLFKNRRKVNLLHVKNPFGDSSFLEDIIVKLVDYERISERDKLKYEANSLSIMDTRSLDLPWITKLMSLSDVPPLIPIPLLFSGKINLDSKEYYALITWMLKGKTLLEEVNAIDKGKFNLLSKTLRELVEGTARLNYNLFIKKKNLSKIKIFDFEERIVQKIKNPLEKMSLELHDSSLLLPPSVQNGLYDLMRTFNDLQDSHSYILGDEDLNLENILIPKIDCGRKDCKPIIIDPVLEFGPTPNLFYTYLADQRKGVKQSEELKLVEEYIDLMTEHGLFKEDNSKLLTSTALLFAVRNLETEIMFIKYAKVSKGEEKGFFLKSIHSFSQYSPLFDVLPLNMRNEVKKAVSYAEMLEEESLNLLS